MAEGRSSGSPEALSIRKNMAYNLVGSLTYQACLWAITVLVVVLSHGYDNSGMLSFAMTIGNMFMAVATYNIRTYQVSDVRNEYSQRNYVSFRLVTIALAVVVIGAYSVFVTPNAETLAVVAIFILFKIDESFVDVLYGIDQRGERMDYIGVSMFVRGILVLAAFSAGMVVFGSLSVAIFLMFPSCLLMTLFYDIPHSKRFDSIRPSITREQVRTLLVSCFPLVLETLFLGMVISVARQYFANAFGNDLLGKYAAVATPAVLIQAAARYLYLPALYPLSERWESDPRGQFIPYFRNTLVIMVVAIVVVTPVLALLGPWALTLVYGESIAPYTYLFTNVLVSTGAFALLVYLADVLIVCRDIMGSLLVASAALAVSAVAMVPLETAFEMQGINYTVLIACLIGILVAALRLATNRKLRR